MDIKQVDQVLQQLDAIPGEAKKPAANHEHPTVHPGLHMFLGTLEHSGFAESFDYHDWLSELGQDKFLDPSFLESADLGTLRKLAYVHLRAERFGAGHLQKIHANGYMDAFGKRLAQLRAKHADQHSPGDDMSVPSAASSKSGSLVFGKIPRLPANWWTQPPADDPTIVWTVWDRETLYLWGANAGNYQQQPIGTVIGGAGMAGSKGPTRGRHHPHYVGVITMDASQMPLNDPVFAHMRKLVKAKSVLVPVFADTTLSPKGSKFSLGTGIGASQPKWGEIQSYLLKQIWELGSNSPSVQIPADIYWPDLRQKTPDIYWIKTLDDIKRIVEDVL